MLYAAFGAPVAARAAVSGSQPRDGSHRPAVLTVRVDQSRLPDSGGSVSIVALVRRAARCRVEVVGRVAVQVRFRPAAARCSGGRFTTRVEFGADRSGAVVLATLRVVATAHGMDSSRRFVVRIGASGLAPPTGADGSGPPPGTTPSSTLATSTTLAVLTGGTPSTSTMPPATSTTPTSTTPATTTSTSTTSTSTTSTSTTSTSTTSTSSTIPATTTTTVPPRPGLQSPNWSGYVLLGPPGGYDGVSGQWTVPALDCRVTPGGWTADWVGVDGVGQQDLFQTGTDSYCVGERQVNFAWWTDQTLDYEVSPFFYATAGDVIDASVAAASPGTWSYSVQDVTTGISSMADESYDGPAQSAEWVAEDPSDAVTTLADFGTVTFGDLAVSGPAAVVPPFPYTDAMEMVDASGDVESLPQQMSGSGSAATFTVTYEG